MQLCWQQTYEGCEAVESRALLRHTDVDSWSQMVEPIVPEVPFWRQPLALSGANKEGLESWLEDDAIGVKYCIVRDRSVR